MLEGEHRTVDATLKSTLPLADIDILLSGTGKWTSSAHEDRATSAERPGQARRRTWKTRDESAKRPQRGKGTASTSRVLCP